MIAAGAWLVGLATIVALAVFALRAIGQHQLQKDATQVAASHARLIALLVPDVDLVFESGRIDPDTQTELNRLRVVGDVFRFKLFNRAGRQLLVSDDLDRSDPVAASAGQQLGLDLDDGSAAEARILSGHTEVVFKDGRGRTDRPATYVEAYVPYGRDNAARPLGVIQSPSTRPCTQHT